MAFVLPSTWQNIVLVLVYSTIMNEKLIGEHANNKSSRELINSALSAWLNAYKHYYVQYWWIETSLWLARWSDKIIAIGWTVDVTIGRRVVKLVSTNKLWFSDRIIAMKIVVESTISTIISSDFDKDLLYSSCSFIEVPCHTVLRVRPVNTPTVTIWRKYSDSKYFKALKPLRFATRIKDILCGFTPWSGYHLCVENKLKLLRYIFVFGDWCSKFFSLSITPCSGTISSSIRRKGSNLFNILLLETKSSVATSHLEEKFIKSYKICKSKTKAFFHLGRFIGKRLFCSRWFRGRREDLYMGSSEDCRPKYYIPDDLALCVLHRRLQRRRHHRHRHHRRRWRCRCVLQREGDGLPLNHHHLLLLFWLALEVF